MNAFEYISSRCKTLEGDLVEVGALRQILSGMVLVPMEPTPEMRRAFHDAHEAWEEGEEPEYLDSPDCEWREMIAAYEESLLPAPPASQEGGES